MTPASANFCERPGSSFDPNPNQERGGQPPALSRFRALGRGDFRRRFREHLMAQQEIAQARGRAGRAVRVQRNRGRRKRTGRSRTCRSSTSGFSFLDADEVLPPEAEAEVRAIVSDPDHATAGYWINRRFMFMGRWLRHAYYPNWNLRLFKHRLGRYEKLTDIDTQSGDNEVHEHVVVTGTTGHLRCEMDHFAFPSVDVFVEKHNRYSNWEARVAVDRHLRASSGRLQSTEVGARRRLKQLSQALPFRGLASAFSMFTYGSAASSMAAKVITSPGSTASTSSLVSPRPTNFGASWITKTSRA
jgi:hypothetical protein